MIPTDQKAIGDHSLTYTTNKAQQKLVKMVKYQLSEKENYKEPILMSVFTLFCAVWQVKLCETMCLKA